MSLGGTIGDVVWHRVIESEGPELDVGFLLPEPRTRPSFVLAHKPGIPGNVGGQGRC